jgi:hypothetical protein
MIGGQTASTSSPETLFAWECTFCSELNGPEIYRCANCRRARELTASITEIEVPRPKISPAEAAHRDRIRSATPLRAAWIYFRGRGDPRSRPSRLGIWAVLLAGLFVFASIGPYREPVQPIFQMVMYGLFALIGGYVSARRYRTDRQFVLAVASGSACLAAGGIALFYLLVNLLPRPDGRPLGEVVVASIAPGADPKLVILVTVGLLVVALVLFLRFSYRPSDRAA